MSFYLNLDSASNNIAKLSSCKVLMASFNPPHLLDRNELKGVLAHELAHINIKMSLCVLRGIDGDRLLDVASS